MTTISKTVQQYVNHHPSVKECLARGLINTSALAREICKASKLNKVEAVHQACRRLKRRLAVSTSHEKILTQMVRRAKIRIRHRMFSAAFGKPQSYDKILELHAAVRREKGDLTIIDGEDSVTVITNQEYSSLVRNTFRSSLRKASSDVVQVTLTFDRKIETTPGVMGYFYGLMREREINVLEEASCWTDIMFVVGQDDLPAVLEALEAGSGKERG